MTARDLGCIQKAMGAHVFRGTLINKNRQHFKLKRALYIIICDIWGKEGTCPLCPRAITTTLAKLQVHSVQDILILSFASVYELSVRSSLCCLSSFSLLSICISCSKHYNKKNRKSKNQITIKW